MSSSWTRRGVTTGTPEQWRTPPSPSSSSSWSLTIGKYYLFKLDASGMVHMFTCLQRGRHMALSLELFFISFSKIIFSIFLWQRYSEMLFGWMEYLPWSVMRARSQLWQIWCIHFALHRFSLLVLFLWFLCDDKHFFVWRKHCAPVKSHCRTITISHSVILSPYPLPTCLEVSTYVVPVPPSWQNFFSPHEHNFGHVDYPSEMLRM